MFVKMTVEKLDKFYWQLAFEQPNGSTSTQVVHNDHLASVISEVQKVVAWEYRRLEYGDTV